MYDPESDAYYIGSVGKFADLMALVAEARKGKETPIEGMKAAGGIQKL